MAGVPVIALLHASPPPSSSPAHVAAALAVSTSGGPDEAASRPVENRVSRADAPAPPSTTTPTTTPVPTSGRSLPAKARTTPTTTARRATTTTTRPAPKPTTSAPKPAPKSGSAPSASASPAPTGQSETGGATWYDAAPPGTCAHKTLPKGTVVTITSLSTGATASCTVADRGPYADGMIIDLAKDVFTRLAPLSQGVVQVRINW
jgi:rare lipoprotein A (peptidoglycan hydrolase)